MLAAGRPEIQPPTFQLPPDLPQEEAQAGMSLAPGLGHPICLPTDGRRHRAGIVFVTAVIIKLIPKTYTATATLMVNYESPDPLAARGIITGPVGTYISTEIELMESSETLLPVVDQLKLTSDPYYTSGYKGDAGELRNWVKDVLAKDLEIEQGRFGSQLIYINASARDPVLAAKIANAVADTYLAQQRQRMSGPGERQSQKLRPGAS